MPPTNPDALPACCTCCACSACGRNLVLPALPALLALIELLAADGTACCSLQRPLRRAAVHCMNIWHACIPLKESLDLVPPCRYVPLQAAATTMNELSTQSGRRWGFSKPTALLQNTALSPSSTYTRCATHPIRPSASVIARARAIACGVCQGVDLESWLLC